MGEISNDHIKSSCFKSEEEYRAGVESKPTMVSSDSEGNPYSILEKRIANSDTDNMAGLITENINGSDYESEEEYRAGVASKSFTVS